MSLAHIMTCHSCSGIYFRYVEMVLGVKTETLPFDRKIHPFYTNCKVERKTLVLSLGLAILHMCGSRGGQGGLDPPPPEKLQKYRFF